MLCGCSDLTCPLRIWVCSSLSEFGLSFLSLSKTDLNQKCSLYLIDMVLLTELVKLGVHGIEHGDNLHWGDLTADSGETNNITEQDCHFIKCLEKNKSYKQT